MSSFHIPSSSLTWHGPLSAQPDARILFIPNLFLARYVLALGLDRAVHVMYPTCKKCRARNNIWRFKGTRENEISYQPVETNIPRAYSIEGKWDLRLVNHGGKFAINNDLTLNLREILNRTLIRDLLRATSMNPGLDQTMMGCWDRKGYIETSKSQVSPHPNGRADGENSHVII